MSETVIRYQPDTGSNGSLRSGRDPMTDKRRYYLFTYLRVHVWALHISVQVPCLYVGLWRAEADIWSISQLSSPYFLKKDLSLNLELTNWLDWLVC